jgi:hypothetical protein
MMWPTKIHVKKKSAKTHNVVTNHRIRLIWAFVQQDLCINKGKKILIVDQILKTPLLDKYILLNYCFSFNTML